MTFPHGGNGEAPPWGVLDPGKTSGWEHSHDFPTVSKRKMCLDERVPFALKRLGSNFL